MFSDKVVGSRSLTNRMLIEPFNVYYRAYELDPNDHLALFHLALQLAHQRQVGPSFFIFVSRFLHFFAAIDT